MKRKKAEEEESDEEDVFERKRLFETSLQIQNRKYMTIKEKYNHSYFSTNACIVTA